MKKNQGFTLIELMIVIAIIAILMAYALPAYRDYTVRAKVGEGLQLASAAKQAVAETFMDSGSFPSTNALAGLADSGDISGANVSSVAVGSSGVITITYSGEAPLNSTNVTLTPATQAGSILWTCRRGSAALTNKYLPAECRTP